MQVWLCALVEASFVSQVSMYRPPAGVAPEAIAALVKKAVEAAPDAEVYQCPKPPILWWETDGLSRSGVEPRPVGAKRRHQVEIAKLIPMRVYLAFQDLRNGESGQAMVEYALILALVSVAAVGILSVLGTSVSSIFSEINADL